MTVAKQDETEIKAAGAPEDAAVAAGLPTRAERRSAAEQNAANEPRFSRERLLGPDGERVVGQPVHVIVGALEGDDTAEFTRAQIQRKVETFLARPVQQEG